MRDGKKKTLSLQLMSFSSFCMLHYLQEVQEPVIISINSHHSLSTFWHRKLVKPPSILKYHCLRYACFPWTLCYFMSIQCFAQWQYRNHTMSFSRHLLPPVLCSTAYNIIFYTSHAPHIISRKSSPSDILFSLVSFKFYTGPCSNIINYLPVLSPLHHFHILLLFESSYFQFASVSSVLKTLPSISFFLPTSLATLFMFLFLQPLHHFHILLLYYSPYVQFSLVPT